MYIVTTFIPLMDPSVKVDLLLVTILFQTVGFSLLNTITNKFKARNAINNTHNL